MCFVYILFSDLKQQYYVGISNNVEDRIKRHNAGESLSTKNGKPWRLVRLIECINKSEASKLELKIKKRGISRFLEDNQL